MLNDSPLAPASTMLRRTLCLAALLALLLLSGCKTEIYQGLSENQANTMLSVLLRHGIPAEKIAAKAGYSIAVQENRIIQALEVLKENSLPREDFQNLGKVAYRRQNFAGLVKTCPDGRTQPGGDLTCQIAATRTVKRESRFLEILFPHNAAYYMTSRTSKSSNDYI